MNSRNDAIVKDLVLVGGGHSHVIVLRKFAMNPLPGVRLTVVARDVDTPYSGMLPGYIAGHYGFDDVHIDLRPLCQFAGARLYHDEAIRLDPEARLIHCRQRPPVRYDVVSINVGSTPGFNDVPGASQFATPVKPINNFVERWHRLVERVQHTPGQIRIGVVGAGAGGTELLLAVQYALKELVASQKRDTSDMEFHLFTNTKTILPNFGSGMKRRFERLLAQRNIHVHTGAAVNTVSAGKVSLENGEDIELTEVLWVTDAAAPTWLRDSGIELDKRGFIQLRDTLQSSSHENVFAAGDVATVVNHPRPKAGVFAVRQGPPLHENLRRYLLDQPVRPHKPQTSFLTLISTGNTYAIGAKWGICVEGHWVWTWKDWIDRRFMRRFSELPDMTTVKPQTIDPSSANLTSRDRISDVAMRCSGCGAKVGADVLNRAISNLQPAASKDVLIGLDSSDDAAVVRIPDGKVMVHTVDYFPAIVDDAYVFGQLAANHALNDIFAMGAQAQTALAIATVPYGLEAKMEDSIRDMMSGAVKTLNDAGATLVGGHTSEGTDMALGFSVNGIADRDKIMRKSGMSPGDVLIITKPIGTGTLFAADMQHKAKGRWIESALASMLKSNRQAAQCLFEYGATACTDITGFGLLGHMLEMIRSSSVSIEIDLDSIPVLDGAPETAQLGILSSLQPANLSAQQFVNNRDKASHHPNCQLIFDPQTSGPLLSSVPANIAQQCLDALHELGYGQAALIGRVCGKSDRPETVTLNI